MEVTQIQQLGLEERHTLAPDPETGNKVIASEWTEKCRMARQRLRILCTYSIYGANYPQKIFPSPKSEISPDDEYIAYHSGSAGNKDCTVPSASMYEKSHDKSFHVSSNCTRDKVYDDPNKHLGAVTNAAKVTQLGEKQSEGQTGSVFSRHRRARQLRKAQAE